MSGQGGVDQGTGWEDLECGCCGADVAGAPGGVVAMQRAHCLAVTVRKAARLLQKWIASTQNRVVGKDLLKLLDSTCLSSCPSHGQCCLVVCLNCRKQ